MVLESILAHILKKINQLSFATVKKKRVTVQKNTVRILTPSPYIKYVKL